MEPRIQYAQTKDGVNIAFWTLGEGPPLVIMAEPVVSHVQLEWQMPRLRRWYEHLAEKRMVVRYDSRGVGLSDREVLDHSLDALVTDLEAVLERLGLDRFALFASMAGGMVAVKYAAKSQERISHLILWCAYARSSYLYHSKHFRSLEALMDVDWETATETWARVVLGGSDDELARQAAAFMRECITQEAMQTRIDTFRDIDIRALLPRLKSPTLVLQRRQLPNRDNVRIAKELASGIPESRLVLMEGSSTSAFLDDWETVLEAIDEFLGEGEEVEPKTDLPEGMAVILFADIAGSTALTERMGDAAFRAKARELDTSLRAIIRECGGTPVEGKVLGDGLLAVFTSARQAIDCALRCNAAGGSVGLQLHLGIHAGDVIREGNNVYGGAVNIAARIAGASAPGEVLVSDTVRGLARTSAGVAFDDRGEHSLKGIEEPQRLFAVREGGA